VLGAGPLHLFWRLRIVKHRILGKFSSTRSSTMYNPNLHFHFTGIGGTGMSGIAEILLTLGFRVSGSDLVVGPVCKRLIGLGAAVSEGHAAENLPHDCSLVVYSSAVSLDNEEIKEAHRRGLPVIRRAEVLAELMRLKFGVAVAGSHGKTTTTTLIGWVLEQAGLDPTVIVGGQVRSSQSGGRHGASDYLVAESDESDKSFLLLRPSIAVVTNIDKEHISTYGDVKELESSFEQFVNSVPFYGLAVLCIDDPRVQNLSRLYRRRKTLYGFSESADIRGREVEVGRTSSSCLVDRAGEFMGRIQIPLLGRHFLQNSLAAVAVGLEFGLNFKEIAKALECFPGVRRRLEVLGEYGGVTLINDYAHHPTEIKAGLSALRESRADSKEQIVVLFQPHRFSRVSECFEAFSDAFESADQVYITDIYAAGEKDDCGVSAQRLIASINHPAVHYFQDLREVERNIFLSLNPGDILVCMGAGSIGRFTEELGVELNKKHRLEESNAQLASG